MDELITVISEGLVLYFSHFLFFFASVYLFSCHEILKLLSFFFVSYRVLFFPQIFVLSQ